MTRLEALRALHEAVKAGRDEDAMLTSFGIFPLAPITHINMILTPNDIRAMGAALALMKAVLPGWDWLVRSVDEGDVRIGNCGSECTGFANIWPEANPNAGGVYFPAYATDPARALLLAILAALIAQAEAQDGPTSKEGEMG